MFEIYFLMSFFVILIAVLVKHKFFWSKKHETLSRYFNGKISLDGSSVDFQCKGVDFLATRLSSGGGLGGTGSYGTLKMFIKESKKIEISLNYLGKIEIKGSTEIKDKVLRIISSDKDLESRLKKSLSVRNATIKCDSITELDRQTGLKEVHSLGIYGLSVPYLDEPSTLETEIETLLILSRALELIPVSKI